MTDNTDKLGEAIDGRPTTTMPKRWSEHRAAAWGTVLGATYSAISLIVAPQASTALTYAGYIAGQIGQLIGGAMGLALIFALVAAVRNLAVVGRRR